MREFIAFGVKATGGDIIAFAKKYAGVAHSNWRPPKGWDYEEIRLPGGATVHYLDPRNCEDPKTAIMQLHGGGYVLGFLPLFQRRSDKLAQLGGGVPVLSLDYRIAPEHPYPAALDDVSQAMEWLAQKKRIHPDSVVTIGESAGAGLSLALNMRLRDQGKKTCRAMVLMSPWVDLTCRGDSYALRYLMDPMFGRRMPPPGDELRTSVGEQYAGRHSLTDPYVSPAFGDFAALPPMLIHVGEYEMLFDDAFTVFKKAAAAEVPVEFRIWPGMFHAFQIADALIPEARQAWLEIGAFMRKHLHEGKPSPDAG